MVRPAPGVYEHLITQELDAQLRLIEPELLHRRHLDSSDAPEVLARHVAALTRRALRAVAERQDDERATLAARLAIANRIAAVIADLTPAVTDADQILTSSEELLTAISDAPGVPPPVRPTVPLGMSALLVNGRGQPRIGTEVSKELASADARRPALRLHQLARPPACSVGS